MKNVAFKQITLFELKANEFDNHSIKLVYRVGYPYPSCYVLKFIVGYRHKRVVKFIFRDKNKAYNKLRELVCKYTIGYINEEISLPF